MRYRSPVIVGRDHHVGAIAAALGATRSGQGGCVFIVGEGGIGKSRIATAAADLGFAAGMRMMRGRSSATGPPIPFRSLTEAVLSLLRSGDPIDLAGLGPYRHVLGRLVPDLRSPSTENDDGSLVILAEALLRLTALAGQGRGCLITLEDLHDADSETLGVVDYLADNVAQQPVLLVGTIRSLTCPALSVAHGAAQRGCGQLIDLGRLNRADVARMVAACLNAGEVPEAALELLWAGSGGNPFLIEDLLGDMTDSGLLTRDAQGWQMPPHTRATRPDTFVRSVRRRIEHMSKPTRELVMAGAMLGLRFPLPIAQAVTKMSDRDLLRHIQGPVAANLVVPDDQTPDWYTFQHPLIHEALLSLLASTERGSLARRTAEAISTTYPDLPGEWCQLSATLWLDAGEKLTSGGLFAEAGRRSLAQGAATSAAALLDKAWELLADAGDASARADVLECLINALSEAGLVHRALALVGAVEQMGGVLAGPRLARLHTRLAWVAMLAGQSVEGLARVQAARELLGPEPEPADMAAVDVVAAHLELDFPGRDRRLAAEAMARRAASIAESVPLPVVACQAWQLLGALVRHRDTAEATTCLERGRALAVRYGLPIWEIHALVRLGNDDALRDGSTSRLEQAQAQASQIGAVTARYQADASIALQTILHGDFDRAASLIDEVLAASTRLKLVETAEYVLLLRAVLAAHRGRRKEMEHTLAQLRLTYGDQPRNRPRKYGMARTFCALLEEDRTRAARELAQAISAEEANPTTFHLSGRGGLHVLVTVLSPETDWSTYQALTSPAAGASRWDRQFALFGRAVVAGREGDHGAAAATVGEALRVGAPYAMGRNLGLRLVAEAALGDGWGDPVDWLRATEEYFHTAEIAQVAGACRALLRTAGVRVAQRRAGADRVPAALRSVGVTVREFEVLQLLHERLGNREIAKRLHLSPRTVERYVSNLLTKTGLPNRVALSQCVANGFHSQQD